MKISNLSFGKLYREARRFIKSHKPMPPASMILPPVPMISWAGPTRHPLKLTSHHREELKKLRGLEAGYQIDILLDATQYIDFRGKTILEIGGSNLPRELIFGILGAKKWICVNLVDDLTWKNPWAAPEKIFPLNHPDSKKIIQDHDYVLFGGSATEIGKELHDEFDGCVSICAFEHIHELPRAVDGIYRSLKVNGIFHTVFGPIWSCDVGHHMWIDADQFNFNKSRECRLPPFMHLLYSASQMDELLSRYYSTEEEARIKNRIIKQCTDESCSNGLFYEDFLQIMKDSLFQNIAVTPCWQSEVDETTRKRLCCKYPNYRSFSVNGIRIVAQK